MVNESGEKQEVPRVLMRLMTALEKWTGGVRTSHAVGAILLIVDELRRVRRG